MSTSAAETAPDADEALTAEWPPGTLVSLQSGGPAMTVSHVAAGKVCVVYWEAQRSYLGFGATPLSLETRAFHPHVLAKRASA